MENRGMILVKNIFPFLFLLLFCFCEEESTEPELDYIRCKWFRYCSNVGFQQLCHSMYLPQYINDAPSGTKGGTFLLPPVEYECRYIHWYEDEERVEWKTTDGESYYKGVSSSNITYTFSRL